MGLGITLVTGASGLLGANLIAEFSVRGEPVIAQYLNHGIDFPGVQSVRCDITDFGRLGTLLHELKPAWIVHCAAATNVDWCERHSDECYRTNAEATLRIAAASRAVGARMVYISTDAVFDGSQGGYEETDEPHPVNVYGKSKLRGEILARSELSSVLIVRTNIYGWNAQRKASLAEWVIERLCSNADVPGFCDVVFSPLLVNDLAACLLEMMEGQLEGTYHVGSRDQLTKYEFAVRTARTFGYDDHLIRRASIGDAEMAAPRPLKTWLRVHKLERRMGRELPSVQSGLNRLKALFETGFVSRLKSACVQEG
jgi:dTDP-4-dehydrorhamnose reductase